MRWSLPPLLLVLSLGSCGRSEPPSRSEEPVAKEASSAPAGQAAQRAARPLPAPPKAELSAVSPKPASPAAPPTARLPVPPVPKPPAVATDRSKKAQRVGTQYVTTYAFLDHLAAARTRGPHLPATTPLIDRVAKDRRSGQTVQNPWGGDGPNRYMHVRVRKSVTEQVRQDLRDCLVVPVVGAATFEVDLLPHSTLKVAPELTGAGFGTLKITLEQAGVAHVLYEDARRARSLWKNRWVEQSFSLEKWSGKVKITFEADNPKLGEARWTRRRGKPAGIGLFALPRILTRLEATDTDLRAKVQSLLGDEMNDNVIMFVFDSMRADLMTPVRDEYKRIPPLTPALDRFADKGVRFTRAFSIGNQTRTGSYAFYTATPPTVGGFWSIRWFLTDPYRKSFYDAEPFSIGRFLHDRGYLTGHLGFNGFLTGFLYLALDMGFDFVSEFNGPPENCRRTSEGVIEWLEEHKDEKFFLLVWYDPPHFPYVAPDGYKQRVYEAGVEKGLRYFAHGYLAKMIYGDEYFGKVVKKVEDLGLAKKTVMIVTADHGEAMDPRHDGYSHNVDTRVARQHGKSFYDEEIHVPLIVRHDGVLPEKKDIKAPVSLVSLAPTIQELLGLPTNLPKQWGKSFATLVRGGTEPEERTVYFEGRWSYGIRTSRYKYIFHDTKERLSLTRQSLWQRKRDGNDEVFDYQTDPEELVNLATKNPELTRKLRKDYFDYRRRLREFRQKVFKGEVWRPIADIGE